MRRTNMETVKKYPNMQKARTTTDRTCAGCGEPIGFLEEHYFSGPDSYHTKCAEAGPSITELTVEDDISIADKV